MPAGSRSIEVGWAKTTGLAGGRRTRTDPSREVAPPACALIRHSPGLREDEPRAIRAAPAGRAHADTTRPDGAHANRPCVRQRSHGETHVHARPATGAARLPVSETRTGPAADAVQANTPRSEQCRRDALHIDSDARGRGRFAEWRHAEPSDHRSQRRRRRGGPVGHGRAHPPSARPVDRSRRRSSSASTSSSSSCSCPSSWPPCRRVWRAGPRYVVAAVVVGAGSSALATILFTQAFVRRRSGHAGRPAEGAAAGRGLARRGHARGAAAAPLRPVPARGPRRDVADGVPEPVRRVAPRSGACALRAHGGRLSGRSGRFSAASSRSSFRSSR